MVRFGAVQSMVGWRLRVGIVLVSGGLLLSCDVLDTLVVFPRCCDTWVGCDDLGEA
ncbi:MAG: hypothetical protein QW291_09300 [Thermofilaceae archaeon]